MNSNSVCVIGSGVAGLSAALALKKAGIQVTIFEASDDYGGRIKSFCFNDSKKIDLGAEEIHGEESEYFKFAKEVGADIYNYWEENNFYSTNKGKFGLVDKLCEESEMMKITIDLFEDISYDFKNEYNDITLKQYLELQKIPQELHFLSNALIGVEVGTDMDKVSMKGFAKICQDWKAGYSNYIVQNMTNKDIITKGFQEIIGNIKYKSQIIKIMYEGNKVIITDSNSNSFEFDYCIIAVPISQLLKIEYNPPLSEERVNAISRIKLDSVAKIVFKFKKRFWAGDTSWILVPGNFNIFWPPHQKEDARDNILMGMISGEACVKMNSLYYTNKTCFIETVLKELQVAMNLEINLIDLLEDHSWFNWFEQPFIQGGYSFPFIGETNEREVSRQNIKNKIYFAGEAFALHGHIGTIHGAMDSGREAANQIINLLQKEK